MENRLERDPTEKIDRSAMSSAQVPLPSSRVQVEVGALSDVGKVRPSNEDAYLVCRIGRFLERLSTNISESLIPRVEESGIIMMVADGMGGHAAGEVASHTALASIVELILGSPKWALKLDDLATREQEIQEVWQRAREFLAKIHATVRDRAASDPNLAGMGTTLTIGYSVGSDLFVIHVGDSRVYLFRDGRVRRVTRDHTWAQHYVDLGLLRPEDAQSGRLQHVLTQAIGGPSEVDADLNGLRLEHADRLVLCTDGLSNLVSEEEMATVLQKPASSQEACRMLVDLALERGGSDNVTTIVASYSIS